MRVAKISSNQIREGPSFPNKNKREVRYKETETSSKEKVGAQERTVTWAPVFAVRKGLGFEPRTILTDTGMGRINHPLQKSSFVKTKSYKKLHLFLLFDVFREKKA